MAVWLVGLAWGLSFPLLVALTGLITELLVKQDVRRITGDGLRLLGPGLVQLLMRIASPGSATAWLLLLVAAAGLLALITAALVAIGWRCAHAAAIDVTDKLRAAIVNKAISLGGAGHLAARRDPAEALLDEKCEQVERGLATYWKAIPSAVVTLASLAIMALLVNVPLTIIVVSLIALLLLLLRWTTARAARRRRVSEGELATARRGLTDYLRGVPLAAGYSLNGPPTGDAASQLNRLRLALWDVRTGDRWILPLLLAAGGVAACFIVLIAGVSVLREPAEAGSRPALSVAGIVVLEGCLLASIVPIVQLVRLARRTGAAETSAGEIMQYLERAPAVVESAEPRNVRELVDGVSLDTVRLADRAGHLLLDDITISLPAGSRTAVVATDDQVPLALAGLLVRYYDPTAGSVLWDGVDVRQARLAALRRRAIVVPADGQIFDGTVAENIRCSANEFSPLEITDAAKAMRVFDFVEQMPQGFSTQLGDGGQLLNAAQAFRIALARAAIREPSLVIVDEPANPGDAAESALIDEALAQLAAGQTLLVLARRIESLRSADRVFLIHEGKLVAAGPHFQLLQSSTLYRHVNYMRFNQFGAAVR